MNRQNIEAEIRAGLDRYYSGEASAAEAERLIADMERLHPLPEDLASELELLRLIRLDAEQQCGDTEIPDGLESLLRMDIRRYAAADRRKMWRRRIARWSIAASVALLVGVMVRYVSGLPVDLSDNTGLASVSVDTTSLIHPAGDTDNVADESSPIETAAVTAPSIVKETHVAEQRQTTPARRIVTATEYSRRQEMERNAEQIAAILEHVGEVGGEIGETINGNLDEAMRDVKVMLSSAINESRIGDFGFDDLETTDTHATVLKP